MIECTPRPRILIKAFDAQDGSLLATLVVTDRSLADARNPADPHLPDFIRTGMDKKARHALITARLLTVERASGVSLAYEPAPDEPARPISHAA